MLVCWSFARSKGFSKAHIVRFSFYNRSKLIEFRDSADKNSLFDVNKILLSVKKYPGLAQPIIEKLLADDVIESKHLTNIISSLYKTGHYQLAIKVFKHVEQKSDKICIKSLNSLLKAISAIPTEIPFGIGLYKSALTNPEKFTDIRTDMILLSSATSMLSHSLRLNSDILREGLLIKEEIEKSVPLFHVNAYGHLISLAGRCGDHTKALELYQEMRSRHPSYPKNSFTECGAIIALATAGKYKECLAVYDALQKENPEEINAYMVTLMLSVCASAGEIEKGVQVMLLWAKVKGQLSNDICRAVLRFTHTARITRDGLPWEAVRKVVLHLEWEVFELLKEKMAGQLRKHSREVAHQDVVAAETVVAAGQVFANNGRFDLLLAYVDQMGFLMAMSGSQHLQHEPGGLRRLYAKIFRTATADLYAQKRHVELAVVVEHLKRYTREVHPRSAVDCLAHYAALAAKRDMQADATPHVQYFFKKYREEGHPEELLAVCAKELSEKVQKLSM